MDAPEQQNVILMSLCSLHTRYPIDMHGTFNGVQLRRITALKDRIHGRRQLDGLPRPGLAAQGSRGRVAAGCAGPAHTWQW